MLVAWPSKVKERCFRPVRTRQIFRRLVMAVIVRVAAAPQSMIRRCAADEAAAGTVEDFAVLCMRQVSRQSLRRVIREKNADGFL